MAGLCVNVLGPLDIGGVDLSSLRSRQARLLLKALAVARGRPVSFDRLIEIIWGDQSPTKPAKQLAVTVSRARNTLGPETIHRTDEGYSLEIHWLDLAELEDLTVEAQRRLAHGAYLAARAAALAGLNLIRGPLLGDTSSDWCAVEREATDRLVTQCRVAAAEAALAVGDMMDSVQQAELLREADPYDEVALRLLMAAYLATGRPGSALAAFATTRERLAEDLGVDPHPKTIAVHEAVLRNEQMPGLQLPSTTKYVMPQASLPGRAGALAVLDEALASTRDHVEIVVIEGEAGIGKTTLLDVWTAAVAARGVPVLSGRCEEIGRALPLQAVADALAAHLHRLEQDDAAAAIGEDGQLLAPLLGQRVPPAATRAARVGDPHLEHETAQAMVFGSVLSIFDRLPGPCPKVLVLDDCHLAGRSTLEWLHFVARRQHEAGLLIVATMRPEEEQTIPGRPVVLEPLDLAAAAEVVGSERAPQLLQRSGGNPLFLIELAAVDSGDIPETLREAVALRCARLGSAACATLRTAAVLGDPIDLDLLAAVTGERPVHLLDSLECCVRGRLIEERAGRFAFRHEVVRDALAVDLSSNRRAWLHRQAAQTLAARSGVDPLRLSFHAERGGQHDVAAAALVTAAGLATARLDQVEAERLLDRSIALADTAEARLARAQVRMKRQQFAAATEDAQVARQLGAGVAALEIQAWAARYNRQVNRSLRLAQEAVRLADNQPTRMRSLAAAGATMHLLGRLREAERYLEEAVAAETDSDLGPSFWLAWLRIHQGRPREALELVQRVLCSPGSALPYAFPLEHALLFDAEALAMLGDAAESLDVLDRVEDESRRRKTWLRYGGVFYTLRAHILRNLGAWDEADRLDTMAADDGWQSPVTGPWAAIGLADGRIRAGDLPAAARHLDQIAKSRPAAYLRWHSNLDAQLLRARLSLAKQDHSDAQRRASELAAEASNLGARQHATLARLTLAQARARAGHPADPPSVEADLAALSEVDGLEAWRLTAELAADYRTDQWRRLAEERLAQLLDSAGAYRSQLDKYSAAFFSACNST